MSGLCRINLSEQFTQADGEIAHALHELGITCELSHVATHCIDRGGELGGIGSRLLELCLLYTSPSPRD